MPDDPLGAANDLGLGDMLRGQLKDDTEDERKKRQELAAAQAAMNPATQMLLGGSSDAFAI